MTTSTQQMTFAQALDWIKLQLNIVDVVGRSVELKKAGRNFMGLCPFHGEKTPSFTVSPEKQLFKCFGCGEGGDALSFLMKRDNKGFGDVIAELAEQYGIELLRDGKAPSSEEKEARDRLVVIHDAAAKYYQHTLVQHQPTQDYLRQRKLSTSIQNDFGLGLAPPGWRNLEDHLNTKHPELKTTRQDLEQLGLLIIKDDSAYDRFRNRLMVPIQNEKGQVVAFGARALAPDDEPKYLNSPETTLYIKHRILFGLPQAKDSIRQQQAAIVMEGYFDVMAAHQVGIKHAVGVCGTALSIDHVRLLSKAGAKTIYLCFDADKAGQNATVNTLDQLLDKSYLLGVQLKVIQLSTGKDPDEFFHSDTPEVLTPLFAMLCEDAQDGWHALFQAQLDSIDNRHTTDGKVAAASKVIPILHKIAQPVLQHEWVRILSGEIGISQESLHLELKQYQKNKAESAYSGHSSYQNKKSFQNQAIPDFSQRYTNSPTGRANNRNNRYATPPRLTAPLVQEEMRHMRRHLAPKSTLENKEAELLTYTFLSEQSWDYMLEQLPTIEWSSTDTRWFSQLLSRLNTELAKASGETVTPISMDVRIQRLREQIDQESPTPEQRHRMLKFLADRVFASEKLAPIYSHSSVTSATGNEKLWRVIDTIVSSLQLMQEKQLLSDKVEAFRTSGVSGDEASLKLEQEIKTMLTQLRQTITPTLLDEPSAENQH